MSGKWVSIGEAARILRKSKRTVEGMIWDGQFKTRLASGNCREVLFDNIVSVQASATVGDETDAEGVPVSVACADTEVEPLEPDDMNRSALSAGRRTERSIQLYSAACRQAKQLAAVYKTELQTSREVFQVELGQSRRSGRIAWGAVAAAGVIICCGIWLVARQAGSIELQQAERAHLADRFRDSKNALAEAKSTAGRLNEKIESLGSRQAGLADQLHRTKLARLDATGQLAAFRTYANQLATRLKSLEAQQRRVAQAQQAKLEAERFRLEQAREAEEKRALIATRARQARAAQARARAKLQQQAQSNQHRLRQGRQFPSGGVQYLSPTPPGRGNQARVRHVHTLRPSWQRANLTLTELQQALACENRR